MKFSTGPLSGANPTYRFGSPPTEAHFGLLSPTQRTSADVVESSLRKIIATAPLADHWFVFQQFRGLQVTLVNFLSQTHPIRNRRDIENYLVRLAQVAALLDIGITEARAAAGKGIIPPRFIIDATLKQIDVFLEPEPAKNVLVTSLDERAARLKDLPAADRAAFIAEAEKTVRDAIVPAYGRVRALLAAQLPKATDDAGLWRLPQGAAAYAAALRNNTTTDLTAEEIHALGLREVARIEGEMDKLLRELGYAEGSVQARMTRLTDSLQPSPTRGLRWWPNTHASCAMPNAARPPFSICGRRLRWRCVASRRSPKKTPRPTTTCQRPTVRGRARFGYRCPDRDST